MANLPHMAAMHCVPHEVPQMSGHGCGERDHGVGACGSGVALTVIPVLWHVGRAQQAQACMRRNECVVQLACGASCMAVIGG
jgi:hypothetical protein